MKANEFATEAANLVGGDRAEAYGDANEGWGKTASIWNAILLAAGHPPIIDAHLAATMMEGLKIVRRFTGPYSADHYIDSAGYAAVAGEIAARKAQGTLR